MVRLGIVPRFRVKIGNRQRDLVLPATNNNLGIERRQRDGEIRHDRTDARVAGEQTVVPVVPFPGVAGVAATFQALNITMTVVPAPRMLREIAADGGDIANLRRTDLGGGLLEAGENTLQFRVFLDFGNGDVRADCPQGGCPA